MSEDHARSKILNRILAGLSGLCVLAVAFFILPLLGAQPPAGQPEQSTERAAPPNGPPFRSEGRAFGPGGFGPPGGRGRGGFLPPVPAMQAIDKDGDGEISAEELAAAPAALRSLDKNSDGVLSGDEILPPMPFGPGSRNRELVGEFDKDGDRRLSAQERAEARKSAGVGAGGGRGFPGGPGFPGGNRQPPEPGKRLAPDQVKHYPEAGLYDLGVLRTLFVNFDNGDWEAELADFNNTDVEVPATLVVDGKTYRDVGVHFRGMSSYMMVPAGYKRSLNLALDFVDGKQRLYGYKTLNLLNAHEDPSFLSSVLYSHIARQYIPAPKANFVRVVINGESWGVYANVQQFNKEFLKENFATSQGTRWKVVGSPAGDGGLRYVGDDVEEYRRRYQIKSGDEDQAWQDLIRLCRTLDETPVDQLQAALEPMLDTDGVLWFLALDCALVNNDGYWTRASDYSIYQDENRKFHLIPHDMNEAFHEGMGPPGGFGPGGPGRPGGFGFGPFELDLENIAAEIAAAARPGAAPEANGDRRGSPGGMRPGGMRRGPGGGGITLDPLVALHDSSKPLRSKLLQVPGLKQKYLQYVKTVAERSLTWDELGPVIGQARELLEQDIAEDTRKLSTTEEFRAATSGEAVQDEPAGRNVSLRAFIEKRREFLLSRPEIAAVESVELPSRPANNSALKSRAERASTPSSTRASPAEMPEVVINELMANNTKSVKDPQGDYDDWIELHNRGSQPVDLSGWYLSDSERAPRKWRFPPGTEIPAGGHLVLWADEDGTAREGLHLNFKLSSGGEELYLINRDDRGNAVVDHVKFGKQSEDVSFGRHPRAANKWEPLVPTAGAPNRTRE